MSSYSSPVTLPRLGQTRCYWALLSSDLHFIYLDPVLSSHLAEQAESLPGKPLLSFVHPDEQASAKADLGGVLQSKTLHGSVTRIRFSRLSKIRYELGYTGPPTPWPDTDRTTVDRDYMTVDIVINWAAEGLVLCFVHAISDDEQSKSDWSNWCGTPHMDKAKIQFLFNRLVVCAQRPNTMSRVFQILANDPTRELLLSWPPDQPDHAFLARDFARLVENAQIGTETDGTTPKTSCTRRYKALQNMQSVLPGQVESIFIPYGSVIFACHKVNSPSRLPPNSTQAMQQVAYNGRTYNSQQSTSYYDSQAPGGPYVLPPLSLVSSSYIPNYSPHGAPAAYPPQHSWPQPGEPPGPYQWSSSSPSSTLPSSVSTDYLASSRPPPHSHQTSSAQYLEPPIDRSVSPKYPYPAPQDNNDSPPSPDIVPPPRRRVSPNSIRGGEPYAPGGRNSSTRPTGVLKCSSCKATSSPEWRKGPSGKKELCNACGLRYARSRAKKEGHNPPHRKRKDKGITKREPGTPPSGSASYTPLRRSSYGDTSFSSAGSNSGSEIYQHPGHHVLDDKNTPSPSPPASSMSFVHYSPTAVDSRPPYPGPNAPFYSVPSPLSNPPVQLEHHQASHNNTQLPPLSYVDRLSPMHSAGSPTSHSAVATMPPASFERDREKERDLRGPLSITEPRHSRRTILAQP